MQKTKSFWVSAALSIFALLMTFSLVACSSSSKSAPGATSLTTGVEITGVGTEGTFTNNISSVGKTNGSCLLVTNNYTVKYNTKPSDNKYKVKLSLNACKTNNGTEIEAWTSFMAEGIDKYGKVGDYNSIIKEGDSATKVEDLNFTVELNVSDTTTYYVALKNKKGDFAVLKWAFNPATPKTTETATSTDTAS